MRALLAAVVLLGLAAAGASGEPRCFGAAARDPSRPCQNKRLTRSVTPTPTIARITPNAPCAYIEHRDLVHVCRFGAPDDQARRTIALIGDSHAAHWRAALEVAAQANGWRGVSIVHTGCPLSKAVKRLPDRSLQEACVRWNGQVVEWLAGHPEIDLVVLGQITSTKGVVAARGQAQLAATVDGYRAAWAALPASVKRVVVMRDNPKISQAVLACVQRAIAARRPAGSACAVRRAIALRSDPAAMAAARAGGRVRLVDMTRFFCDAAQCKPVIGGVLVYKDAHHITRVYGTTLGPYLSRALSRL